MPSNPGLLISEILANPNSTDSPFEYVELIATQTIDFSVNNYSIVFSNNGTATTNGWIAGGSITYGFNITTGIVNPGDVVYVGGSLMTPTGTKLRTINTATSGGDGFGNANSSGVLGNGGSNADGIAVFASNITNIINSTVPVDAIFFGTAIGTALVSGGTAGYQLPVNDLYNGGKLQTSSFIAPDPASGQVTIATGTFNTITNTFDVNRTWANSATPTDNSAIALVTNSAGLTISQSEDNTTVEEGGVSDSYTIVLNSEPSADVEIAIAPDGELSTDVNILTFNSSNWNVPQTVTVTAVDDGDLEGNHSGSIQHTTISSDTNYDGITNNLNVDIADNDTITILIRDIQGSNHISPLNGQAVNNVEGIVTAIRSNGFYFEDLNPDSDDSTSEGIFVFTSSAPSVQVGDAVKVSGNVTEFRPGGNLNNLTITEIVNPTVVVVSSGNSLPLPTIIGTGGRAIPTSIIEDEMGNVETSGLAFDPVSDGIDFLESLEGMRVQINNPVAVSPTNSFGEFWVLGDSGNNATGLTTRGGIVISADDFNPERIQIDDTLFVGGSPTVDVGAVLSTIVGVVDYNFNNYEILPTIAPTVITSSSLTKEVTEVVGTSDILTVANFNVENLDPGDPITKFNDLADRIVNNLKSPDIIVIEEVQDNNGATNNSIVDASLTYQSLIDAIALAGGPTYEYRQIDPQDDADGGEPGGNIRQGFLFNPTRTSFIDIPGGGSLTNTTVTDVGGVPTLSANPGRIDPTNTAFNNSRKPLVGQFTFNGETVTIVGNHFNSKGGDQPLYGPNQPPNLTSEVQRNQQATAVANFVQSILAIDPNANVIVAGDLNDFEFSNPLSILESAGLTTLIETLPANERYTYNFQGNAQSLDHIMASANLTSRLDSFDVVHINSEFADQISDHDPSIASFVIPVPNVAPIANNDTTTTTDKKEIIIDVLTNDSDSDGILDSNTLTLIDNPTQGTVIIELGAFKYTPSIGFVGSDSFTYQVNDDDGEVSNLATVTIDISLDTDPILGSSENELLEGDFRNDLIRGFEGNDTLIGVDGNDSLEGGIGVDSLEGGNGNDLLNGGTSNDTLKGGEGNDIYIVNSSGDIVIEALNAGIDLVKSSTSTSLSENVENLTLIGSGNVNGSGNELNNRITGNIGNNLLEGKEGNDFLKGGSGNDILKGGTGNDNYWIYDLGDIIIEDVNEGSDFVRAAIDWTLGNNLENLVLLGSDPINGTGNNLNNLIVGNSANNNLDGQQGNDRLYGQDGDDTLNGNIGNDILRGGTGNDSLVGDANNDRLYGEDNDDFLNGGAGSNILTGGTGADKFLLSSITGIDTINDFEDGVDAIALSGISFSQLTIAQGIGSNLSNTLINFNDGITSRQIAVLINMNSADITETDFLIL